MSVKPDSWIRAKSTLPKFILTSRMPMNGKGNSRIVESASHLTETELEALIVDASLLKLVSEPVWPQPISYRELTQEEKDNFKPLISPFVEKKTNHLASGKKVPSFGLSSYGYDIRLGRDYKLFNRPTPGQNWEMPEIVICNVMSGDATNHYDEDIFIMPAHSFALAVSVERIVVPSDCIVICMAKSTVSRGGLLAVVTPLEPGWCFTGDTKVALVNGTSVSFVEMVERSKKGERFFGYAMLADGSVGVTELIHPRKVKDAASLVEVTLDNGESIECTPDHKFLLKDGTYKEAENLKPFDSLMPLYRYVSKKGYESVASAVPGKSRPISTYLLADDWNIKHKVYSDSSLSVKHHVDFNPRNNNPTNIVRVTDEEHHRIHETKEGYAEERRKIGELGALTYRQNHESDESYSETMSQKSTAFWENEEHVHTRANWLEAHRAPRPWRKLMLSSMDIYAALKQAASVRGAAKLLNCGVNTLFRNYADVIADARLNALIPNNHKVVSVKVLSKKEDVYCLEAPEASNFALEAGVFVHNCGYVTLELSNSTDSPIKLTSGMGIMQMIFLQANEPCEADYAKMGGKYQNQAATPVMPI